MDLRSALLLVREKYIEETNGTKDGPKTAQYVKACQDFPALMNVAHHLWARELMKGMP
jgi:hypothetical protein